MGVHHDVRCSKCGTYLPLNPLEHVCPKQAKWEVPDQTNTDKNILAYLAGLFDSEGTFVIQGERIQYSSQTIIYNNNYSLLAFVQKYFGGRLFQSPDKRINRQPSFVIQYVNKSGVNTICRALLPYLRVKKRQAELLIEAISKQPIERASLREEVRNLNARCVQLENPPHLVRGLKDVSKVDSTVWAYFAGYMDGDGSFMMQPQKWKDYCYFYPWVYITGSKLEPMVSLSDVFGGNVVFREVVEAKYRALKGEWIIQDQKQTEAVLKGLMSYLMLKRKRAQICLKSLEVEARYREKFRDKISEEAKKQNEDLTPLFENFGKQTDFNFEIKEEVEVKEARQEPVTQTVSDMPAQVEATLPSFR